MVVGQVVLGAAHLYYGRVVSAQTSSGGVYNKASADLDAGF